MSNETPTGPAGAPDRGRHPQSGGGVSSPLQARAQFLKNWDWQSVIGINRGACERGRAQHGVNSETGSPCAKDWEALGFQTLTLAESLDQLRSFHRRAPFLFFNGNTFATIGRELAFALFSDLPPVRKREVASAIAHCIAGVLDRDRTGHHRPRQSVGPDRHGRGDRKRYSAAPPARPPMRSGPGVSLRAPTGEGCNDRASGRAPAISAARWTRPQASTDQGSVIRGVCMDVRADWACTSQRLSGAITLK